MTGPMKVERGADRHPPHLRGTVPARTLIRRAYPLIVGAILAVCLFTLRLSTTGCADHGYWKNYKLSGAAALLLPFPFHESRALVSILLTASIEPISLT